MRIPHSNWSLKNFVLVEIKLQLYHLVKRKQFYQREREKATFEILSYN